MWEPYRHAADQRVLPAASGQKALQLQHERLKLLVHGCANKEFNFAWTCHKLQGKTEDRITLACTNKCLNWNYTALSRIRALKVLFVLKGVKLTTATFNKSCDRYDMLVAEMARLDVLSVQTLDRVAAATTPTNVPTPPSTRRSRPVESPGQQVLCQSTKAERDFVIECLTIMFNDGIVEDGGDTVTFSEIAVFLRESRRGLAAFPNDDHLAAVLADVSRLNNTWMATVDIDDNRIIIKI